MAYDADLALALRIADEVDALTIAGSLGAFAVEFKPDDTPVTAIDRGAERLVRDILAAERPEDAIQGEEYGYAAAAENGRRWVIDPIDGTKNFVRGVPSWGTLIGLVDGDDVVVGVVCAPAVGRRWYASQGGGAWAITRVHGYPADPRRIHVSQVATLADASISYSEDSEWIAEGRGEAWAALKAEARRTRAFGDFWSYMLVAEGVMDIAAEPELALHDMTALVPIVTEAGGVFTSLDGTPGPFGTSALATNGLLHEQVLARLA